MGDGAARRDRSSTSTEDTHMADKSEASRRASAEAERGRIERTAKAMTEADAAERQEKTERLRAERLSGQNKPEQDV